METETAENKRGTLILDARQIDQKLKRIAYQVYETNFEEKEIYLAGINGAGYQLAGMLIKELKSISELGLHLIKVEMNKEAPSQDEIRIDYDLKKLKNKVVLLVDDVQNTGKTFAYGLRPFLNTQVKKIQIAVLVNRAHTLFPVAPNFTGFELSTTLDEHINVVITGSKRGVFLH